MSLCTTPGSGADHPSFCSAIHASTTSGFQRRYLPTLNGCGP